MAIDKISYPSVYPSNGHINLQAKQQKQEFRYKSLDDIYQEDSAVFDGFFRDNELYDDTRDSYIDTFEYIYEPDDVPAVDPNKKQIKIIDNHKTYRTNPALSKLPEYVVLKRNGKKFYPENILLSQNFNQLSTQILDLVQDGYSLSDLINIVDYCRNENYINKEVIDLLKKPYPIDYILDIISKSTIKNMPKKPMQDKQIILLPEERKYINLPQKSGEHFISEPKERFIPELVPMMEKYPEYRSLFIYKDQNGNEKVNYDLIEVFPSLYKICKNKKDLCKLISDYKYIDNLNGEQSIFIRDINIAKFVYKKQNRWEPEYKDIVTYISSNPRFEKIYEYYKSSEEWYPAENSLFEYFINEQIEYYYASKK